MSKVNANCIVLGAGPAGVGIGVVLKELGVDFEIIEKGKVGNSFLNWTKETKFISPSFTSNMFNIPDLNAITPLTSPAFSFNKEHLSGKEYAKYLGLISNHYKLPVVEGMEVVRIEKTDKVFNLTFKNGDVYSCKYLVWCGGEWNFPKKLFKHSLHTNTIKSYLDLKEGEYVVIGGGESGVDMAYNLILNGKKVNLITENDIDVDSKQDDPSRKLSPLTIQKFNEIKSNLNLNYIKSTIVLDILKDGNKYIIELDTKKSLMSITKPFEATGFKRVPEIISNLVDLKDGDLLINKYDESMKTPNLFFAGPNLHRESVILCFIYKFRMRFSVVAAEIAKREKSSLERIRKVVKFYKKYNMHLEDIHACDINCEC